MSIIYESTLGWYISHEIYVNEIGQKFDPCAKLNEKLFEIHLPYRSVSKIDDRKRRNRNKNEIVVDLLDEFQNVKVRFSRMLQEMSRHFENINVNNLTNKTSLDFSDMIYERTKVIKLGKMVGANVGSPVYKNVCGEIYLFPENCRFYCDYVENLNKHFTNKEFDVILLDPPWRNKYIRRKRKKSSDGYNMMYDRDLQNLPLESILKDDGLVVVWCTNSLQHRTLLINEMFSKWNLNFLGRWYWVKITKSGQPVCQFSAPPRKQPFEQIVFGSKSSFKHSIPQDKLVISVPSVLHSHKPPLVELLKHYLPESPNCLEIFSRYLLPNWTSYGNEVFKFQHSSLYVY